MANFQATNNPDNIVAGGGIDGVTYDVAGATDGVIVRVKTGGKNGFAQGDTYTGLTFFELTDLAGEIDRFTGGSADEDINGQDGRDVIKSLGGNDTLRGGDGDDSLDGGANNDVLIGGADQDEIQAGGGNDLILVAAGDVVAGETINGSQGTDTIRIVNGGTGTEVDLTGATITKVEEIEFKADADLKIDDALLNTLLNNNGISGSAARTAETVEITDWTVAAGNVDLSQAKTLLDAGIDEVRWSGDNNSTITFTVEEIDGATTYIQTEVDGTTTTTTFFNDSLQKIRETTDVPDLQTTFEFDPATGDKLNKTIFDTSADGSAENFEFIFETFDANGLVDFELDQRDSGRKFETVFVNGVKTFELETKASGITVDTFFVNGNVERTVETPINPANAVNIRGNNDDQTFTATDAKERINGLGGDDTFVFSGDVGDTNVLKFDDKGDDQIDLTAYGVDSLADLGAALSFNGDDAVIDVSQIGGTGTITLQGVGVAGFGDDDFVLV